MFEATDKKKKEHVQLAQAQMMLLTLGTQWGMLLAGSSTWDLPKKQKKSLVLVFKLMINAVSGILNSQVDCFVCFIYQKKKKKSNLSSTYPLKWHSCLGLKTLLLI